MFQSFTVGIPVYNEEALLAKNAGRLIDYLRGLQTPFELLIGSNGSTDGTETIGGRIATEYPELSFFHLPRRGVGLAFREFVRLARYDLLLSLDMDLSIDLDFVPQALEQLASCDIVVGSKQSGDQRRSAVRTAVGSTYVRLCRWLLGLGFDDYSMAAKGYRVSLLRQLPRALEVESSSYVTHVLLGGTRSGAVIRQIPVRCEDHRRSRFNLISEGLKKGFELLYLSLTSRWHRGAGG